MYLKKMYLIIVSSVLVLLIGISIFQFIFWNKNTKELKGSYEEEIVALEKAVSSYGPMGSVWTVSNQTSPGQEVTLEDLVSVEMLGKNIGKTYITDPNKIIGKYFKIALMPGTPLTEDIFMYEIINDSVRQFEVVSSTIPVGLQVGDYIDYRFLLPKGEDYVVMPHKRVEGLYDKVITLHMTEEEIHTYQSLLVDYFINYGSQIYMTKYLEPSIQKPAQKYYPISNNILNLMSIDPNVTELIEESIIKNRRAILENSLKSIQEDIISKIGSARSSIKSDLDSANSTFSERIEMREQQQLLNGENPSDTQTKTNESGSIPSSNKLQQNSNIIEEERLDSTKEVTQSEKVTQTEDNNNKPKPTTSEKKEDSSNGSKVSKEPETNGVVE